MIWVFEIVSPGSDLDGEWWECHELTRRAAEGRADTRLVRVFALASPERKAVTTIKLVGTKRTWGAEMVPWTEERAATAA